MEVTLNLVSIVAKLEVLTKTIHVVQDVIAAMNATVHISFAFISKILLISLF